MREITLKTDPDLFQQSVEGKRDWEIRLNDRNFQVGDILILKETKFSGKEMKDGAELIYTGRELKSKVISIFDNENSGFGLEKDWVILSVSHLESKG